MKRLIKGLLKTCWRATLPIRRPIAARLDAYMRRLLWPVLRASDDMDLAFNHVVRELIRLQDQVEDLQQSVDDLRRERDRLSVVPSSGERKAG